jgi:hypothetical protein
VTGPATAPAAPRSAADRARCRGPDKSKLVLEGYQARDASLGLGSRVGGSARNVARTALPLTPGRIRE